MVKGLPMRSWGGFWTLDSPTLAHIADDSPIRGVTAKITRVNFQPRINPTTKPAKNDVMEWKNIPILSPIPSLILKTSLKQKEIVLQIMSDLHRIYPVLYCYHWLWYKSTCLECLYVFHVTGYLFLVDFVINSTPWSMWPQNEYTWDL